MSNFIVNIIRRCSISHNRSKTPTSLLPLRELKDAVVLLDWNASDAQQTSDAVLAFFKEKGIKLTYISQGEKGLNIFGRLKTRDRLPEGRKVKRHEDLFLSLLPGSTYAEEFEAFCSPAKFKIGRGVFRNRVYDFQITDPEGTVSSQSDVFAAVRDFMLKIK